MERFEKQYLREEMDMSDSQTRNQVDKWMIVVQECLWFFCQLSGKVDVNTFMEKTKPENTILPGHS